MIRTVLRGWTLFVCWWLLIFVFAVFGRAQQIPEVNHNGVTMYSPDKPFETLSAAEGITSGSLQAVLNPLACGTGAKPAWCSGSELGAWINSAIAACPSSGCQIEIPALTSGTSYSLGSPIIVTKNKVNIRCDSKAPMVTTYSSTPLGPDGYYYGPVDVTGDYFKIEGCYLDLSSFSVGLNGIHLFGSKHSKVLNNTLYSSRAAALGSLLGVRIEGKASNIATDDEVSGNWIRVPYIALSTGDYSENGIVFRNNYTQEGYEAFDFNGSGCGGSCPGPPDSYGIRYVNNTAINYPNSSYVESASDVLIANNHFVNDGALLGEFATLRVHQTTTNGTMRVNISNNEFIGSATTWAAIHVFQNASDYIISGNTIRMSGADGILIDSTSGTPIEGLISGNIFANNGTSNPSGGFCGVRLHQSSGNNVGFVTIFGNYGYDDQVTHSQLNLLCSDGARTPFQLIYSMNMVSSGTAAYSLPDGCSGCTLRYNGAAQDWRENGSCTMAAGTCSAQTLAQTYSAAPACFANWTGAGTLTGLLKVPSTTTTVTPASSVGTDTAVVNWGCFGN